MVFPWFSTGPSLGQATEVGQDLQHWFPLPGDETEGKGQGHREALRKVPGVPWDQYINRVYMSLSSKYSSKKMVYV